MPKVLSVSVNNNSPSADMYGYEAVYRAEIMRQSIDLDGAGNKRLILTVRLRAKLRDPWNPSRGADDCPIADEEVWITVVPDNPTRMRFAARDLDQLGLADHDISRLHPQHPELHCLVGRQVYVRPRSSHGAEYWNLMWFEKSKSVSFDDLCAEAATLKTQLDAAAQPDEED